MFLNHRFNLEDRKLVKINKVQVRSGVVVPSPERIEGSYEALRSLAVNQLGYGCRLNLVDITETNASINMVNRVVNCVDTTIFSGSPEAMTLLLEFIVYYNMVVGTREVLSTLGVKRHAFFIPRSGVILNRNKKVVSALSMLAGLNTEKQIVLAEEVVSFNNRSMNCGLLKLIQVIERVRELGDSFEDACQQIGGVRLETAAI